MAPSEAGGLSTLVKYSARLGSVADLSQGPGGNTSLKLGGTLHIKASGKNLQGITGEGFVAVNIAALARFYRSKPSPRNEQAAFDNLAGSRKAGSKLMPSMEAGMHAFIPSPFVFHCHPVHLNAIACSLQGRRVAQQLLGAGAFNWVPYTTPGHRLAIEFWRQAPLVQGPPVFLLENHGLTVGAGTALQAFEKTQSLENAAKGWLQKHCPVGDLSGWKLEEEGGRSIFTAGWLKTGTQAEALCTRFQFPDHAVFSKLLQPVGREICIGAVGGKADSVAQILCAAAYIRRVSEKLGGPKYLPAGEAGHLLGMSSEKYRQK